MKTMKDLTDHINRKFDTSFEDYQISYRVDKFLRATFGTADEDAYYFVNLAQENVSQDGGLFKMEVNAENQLIRALFVSNVMYQYSQIFLDVVVVDATYKRNRFNLPLVNIIGINNAGSNILLAFALISNEKSDSYDWIFLNLKNCWKKSPLNIVCDQCPSINQGKKY